MSFISLNLTACGAELKAARPASRKSVSETEIVLGFLSAGLAVSTAIVLHALSVAF